MKCKHEWRLFGTRLEESVSNPGEVTMNSGPIICTKCGMEQSAEGYEYIEERPVPAYSGSWASFSQDIIVTPKKFGIVERTVNGYNSRTDKFYDESKWKWDGQEQQWVKTFPITWKDYWKVIKELI
jgi:hypothetical protein